MQRLESSHFNQSAGSSAALVVVVGTWVLAMVGAVMWMVIDDDRTNPFRDFYLIPWVVMATTVVALPSFYYLYKGKFDPFHPLIFPFWSYIFPALIFGGVLLSTGLSVPYFYSYIQDPESALPLSLIYIALGFVGAIVGYALPFGRIFGTRIQRSLPKWQWSLSQTWMAGWIFVAAGTMVNVVGFVNGLLGFQRAATVEAFDGTIFFLLTLFFLGYFLLWYALFRTPQKDASYLVTLTVLILLVPLRAAIMGNRGSILLMVLPIAFAYIVSGQKMTIKHGFIFAGLVLLAVFTGMIYGTSFRNVKGTTASISSGDYIGQIGETLDYIWEKDFTLILADGGQSLADRLENLSSLGVVVSNYEKLAPYEDNYGLSNNILRDTATALIPRFVWPDKPLTSDAHAYSELYFDYEDNSFAITVFGDLLRNFGPIGVPLGMILVGVFLRMLHATLGTPVDGMPWRSAVYYILLTSVSYEAFYATLFPSLVRVTVICIITLYLVNLFTSSDRRA